MNNDDINVKVGVFSVITFHERSGDITTIDWAQIKKAVIDGHLQKIEEPYIDVDECYIKRNCNTSEMEEAVKEKRM